MITENRGVQAGRTRTRVSSPNREYQIDNVQIEGWDSSSKTLIEAKDQYSQFVTNGQFDSWWGGTKGLLNEAISQINVAQKYGLNLRWVSNNQDFVDTMKNLLTENNVPDRNMIQWQVRP